MLTLNNSKSFGMNGFVVVCNLPSDRSVELRRLISFATFSMSLLENDCSDVDDIQNFIHCNGRVKSN